jgi:hypothetical protein
MSINDNIDSKLLNNSYKKYLIVIIIGYFAVKIVYSLFFKIYSNKYYNKDVLLNTTGSSNNVASNIVINSYLPYSSNSELTDFSAVIIFTFIVFIFTEKFVNSIFSNSLLNINFLMGYILGMTYPLINSNINDCKTSNTIVNNNILNNEYDNSLNTKATQLSYLLILFFCIIFISIITLGNNNGGNKMHIIITYIIVIVILIYGLYASKDNKYTLQNMSISTPNKLNYINKFIIYSGEKLNITVPFICWLLLILFSINVNNDNSFLLYFINGVLLGIFVSGVSFYGIQYILNRNVVNSCNNMQDCINKLTPASLNKNRHIYGEEEHNDLNIKNLEEKYNKLFGGKSNNLKMYTYLVIITLIFVILVIYFYFFSN